MPKTSVNAADIGVIHHLVAAAKAKLEPGVWDYVMGGAETESTLLRNRLALDSIGFRPRVLRNVETVDARNRLLGIDLRLPVILAPIGSLEDVIVGGTTVPSNAAAQFGAIHMLSSVAQPGLEDIAKCNDAPKLFQLYIRGDADWTDRYIERVVACGYKGLALTVDLAWYGRRERDIASDYKPASRRDNSLAANRVHQLRFDWSDVARIKRKFDIPIILKGIATAEDAGIAVDHGADVVYVSNHGGRQLDHGKGAIEVLPEVVAAVRGRAQIVVDGGFMRGTDIVKAMALGADAVGIGKLQALAGAAAGVQGLVRLLEILEDEVIRCLGLLGVTRYGELSARHLTSITPIPGRGGLDSAFPLIREGY